MPRSQSDVANTALRIFLQDVGEAYDQERGLTPFQPRDFQTVREFFLNKCCYCGDDLAANRVAQDHLIPMNKSSLGLHAWGNIVPACLDCNAKKQGREWHAYLVQRAGSSAAERYERIASFLKQYKYNPDLHALRDIAEELYTEVGAIATTLITAKISRFRRRSAQSTVVTPT
jgi:hypothetical protein